MWKPEHRQAAKRDGVRYSRIERASGGRPIASMRASTRSATGKVT
jgi:hypothetical protein